ncbi:MAG TPA: asparaginase domain-containing protein [Candidatus Saccharimonadales bacterium]|nr:asparaginase domain-containing protein [Candidatus Saccharimonadales bacterium]
MKTSLIHFIITGGTIDSFYDTTRDTVVPNKQSVLPSYISSLKLFDEKIKFTTICMKDSRELNNEDRKNLLKELEITTAKKIIITHGTYTMPDTARFIKVNLKRADQTIILTASMIPLNGFNMSDAPFNLGYAFAKVQDLNPGVYACMNGHVFDPEEIVKNIKEGKFESIFTK